MVTGLRAHLSVRGNRRVWRCGTARDCPCFFALSAAPQGRDGDGFGECVDAFALAERARSWPSDRRAESRFKHRCYIPFGCKRYTSMMWPPLSEQKDYQRQCSAGPDSSGRRNGAFLDLSVVFNTARDPCGPAFLRGHALRSTVRNGLSSHRYISLYQAVQTVHECTADADCRGSGRLRALIASPCLTVNTSAKLHAVFVESDHISEVRPE